MLALDLIDRRTMWRDYWIEWMLAAVFLSIEKLLERQVAALAGAPVPMSWVIPPLLISLLAFPVVAFAVSRVDRWRLGR